MKKLTIIIPAYNLGHWLIACMESIMAQTDCSALWDIVAIDDGSTDGTGMALDHWSEKFAGRMQVFHIPNGGVNPAREFGLLHADGEYVWFVDGDDLLHPQAIETYLRLFESRPDVQIWVHEFKDGEKITFDPLPSKLPYKILSGNLEDAGCVCVCGCVFRHDHIASQTFPNLLVGEDLLFANRQLARAKNIGLVNTPLYGYIMRPTSISHTPSVKRVENLIHFNKEMVRFYAYEGWKLSRDSARGRLVNLLFGVPAEIINGYRALEQKILLKQWAGAVRETVDCRINRTLGFVQNVEVPLLRLSVTQRMIAHLNRFVFRWYVKHCGVGKV